MQSTTPSSTSSHLQLIHAIRREDWRLVRQLQLIQRACWNRSLSAELSGLILAKTSRYNVRMVAVSCPLLRDTANAAEPIKFETSPWAQTRIAAGTGCTVCVDAGGRVFAWGGNEYGQLGVGDRESRVVPTLVTGSLKTKTVVHVTAGNGHTACLTADGLVSVCGYGARGQLGVGDTKRRVVPTLVRGELEGRKVLQVAAGGHHTVCVDAGGRVFAWGGNEYGQLGVVDTKDRLVPTLLRGELENKAVLQVAAGRVHTSFMTADGLVFACGLNNKGQLGVGSTDHGLLVPTLVTGQLQGKTAVYVAAGMRSDHTLCITADGSLFAWGDNCDGQLGVGDTEYRSVPTLVTALQGKQVAHVAAAQRHTICTTADGSMFTWGRGGEDDENTDDEFEGGQLGLGFDRSNKLVPTLVRGELLNKAAVQVAAGNGHSACVTEDGSVYIWGDNRWGQLGVAGADVDGADLPMLVQELDINATV